MEPLLRASEFNKNTNVIIPNITAIETKDYIADYLVEQIDGPVRWIQSIDQAKNLGLTRYIEFGPGKVLNGLVKRILPKDGFEVHATDDVAEAILALKPHS